MQNQQKGTVMEREQKSGRSPATFFFILLSFIMIFSCKGSSDLWNKVVTSVSAKEITAFGITDPASTGLIDESTKAISIAVPYGSSLNSLVAQFSFTGIKVSVGEVEQVSGKTVNDFSTPVLYSVTAVNGTVSNYTVSIIIVTSSSKDITAFTIKGKSGTIGNSTISIVLPYGTSLTSLTPVITHTGASISPASGIAQNFTNPVTYTVTAADSSTKAYTVTASTAMDNTKDITKFSILGKEGVISGTDITVTVPYGTDVTSLIPTVDYSGTSISPASGTVQDFTNPVSYTVTAADGSTKSYKAAVVSALSSSKDIISFDLIGVSGTIAGTYITLTVPYGTNLSSLAPSITHSGASITPSAGTYMDFTTPVIYTVTAVDASIKQYTVTVSIAASDSKDITAFIINGTSGIISGTGITVTLPYGSSVNSLAPVIMHTGASVSPVSEAYCNFTNPVTYTVTAADSSVKSYTVTVAIAANSAKDITYFGILGTSGIISGTDISVVLPYGTNAASLSAACTHTGATISPSPFIPQNYTSAIQYTVTAADSSTKNYTVTVTISAKIAVTGLSISPASPIVTVKNTTQLLPVFTPSNASIQTVTWASSDQSIASIDASGAITGKKSGFGDVIITCTSTDNPLVSASKTITVLPASGASETASGSGIKSTITYNLTSGATYTLVQTTPDTIGSSPITLPIGLLDVGTVNMFKSQMLGETEVTYEVWHTVYSWAILNGYTFSNAGQKGSPGSGNVNQPVTNVSWRDAIVWCNAFTEGYNLKNGSYPDLVCAYYNDSSYTTPIRSTSDSNIDSPYVYYTTAGNTDNSICTASGFRLPGTYEWEYAARYLGTTAPTPGNLATEFISQNTNGGSSGLTPGYFWTPGDYACGATYDYMNTSAVDLVAWYSGNATTTMKVKQKAPNYLGIYDMSGNVREWCFEIAYSTYRADRGGSYYNSASFLEIGDSSTGNAPNFASDVYGFRIAKNR